MDHSAWPVECLRKAASVLAPNGIILTRNHPWCSRHGGHIYDSTNKAYAHLLLPLNIVTELAGANLPTKKVLHPIAEYRDWIAQSGGLEVKSEDVIRTAVDDFFKIDKTLMKALQDVWKKSLDIGLSISKQ